MVRRILGALLAIFIVAGCNQRSATQAPGGNPMPEKKPAEPAAAAETHAFVVDLADGQALEDVQRATVQVFGKFQSAERLFPAASANDDPEQLSRIFRVVVAGPGPDGGPWDDAYALRDAGKFRRVEPDEPLRLEPRVDAAAAAPLACANNAGAPPADHGWAPRAIRLAEARTLAPPTGGKTLGEGIRVCHPDTGWTQHVDLDDASIDKTHGLNLIDGNIDTQDPLGYGGNPGHGTGTGSLIISAGEIKPGSGTLPPSDVVGVAPKATLVPIRAIKSVVQVFDSDVARAVNHATVARCDVISMSLGGKAFFGLERAVKDAVRKGVVVVSAAGNCVGFVVAPASYANSIAAAATNVDNQPWKGSSKGSAVDISAPGEDVWAAEAGPSPFDKVKHGDGTSYATAEVAGAAALWLAFFHVGQTDTGISRHEKFLAALRASAHDPCTDAGAPAGCSWDKKKYGPGILDLRKLLSTPPGSSSAALAAEPRDDTLTILARMFDRDVPAVRVAVARLLGNPPDLDRQLENLGPELVDIATRDPAAFRGLLGVAPTPEALSQPPAAALSDVRARASRRLAAQIRPTP